MPALEFVPPIGDTIYQALQNHGQSYQQPSPPQTQAPVKPENADSCQRQTSPYPQETATDMYRHPSPVGSYHSMSPFNYTTMASQQQTQFPEFTAQFQHHPSMITSAATNLSPCAETSPVAAQQHPGSPAWPPVSSALPGYPSSPATGGSDWVPAAYQCTDSYPVNSNGTVFPTITGSTTATCAMPGSIPSFEDYTTGYPAQMYGQQGMMSQMRCSYEWAKASGTYRVNPQTGKTRTKDKYRVVYTDHQRLELEKEFHYSRYITIRRKAELAVSLGLSERQVKIWFQNRRAKERKQSKKRLQSQQGSDNQDELDEDEKHVDVASPSTSPAAIKHELSQQQRTTDGDFMLGNACAQSVKSELVDSFMVPQTDLSKNSELLNALRNGTHHHHHAAPPQMAS